MADEELVRMIKEQGTDGLKEWRLQNSEGLPDLGSTSEQKDDNVE